MRDIARLPYIGITGVTDEEQAHLLCMRLGDHEDATNGTLTPGRRLMIGVLVSDKTLRGESNKHPNRFPPISWLPRIFKGASEGGDALTLRIAHYNTHDPDSLGDQLIRLYMEYGGGVDMNGIQLNVRWPDPGQLEKYWEHVPNTHRVILQLGSKAMQGHSVDQVAVKVRDYRKLITDVLVDPSGGEGLTCDPRKFRDLLEAISDTTLGEIGLGFAGGLSAESSEQLKELYWQFPTLSIDAEGRLRDENDQLDLERALDFIEAARSALMFTRDHRH